MFSVLFLYILLTPAPSKGHYESEVIPQNPYIELGSDIKIVIKSEEISHSHAQIYWTLNNDMINESFYEINSSFAAVSLYNFTLQKATIQCHSYTGQVLGGTFIRTYQRPTNITCIRNISKRMFTCYWEMDSSLKVNYTVYMNCPGERISCSTDKLSCTFDSRPILNTDTCTVIVRARTTVWEVDSDSYDIEIWHIIKLEPPKNVIAETIPFSNHLRVKWDRPEPHYFGSHIIHCQVKNAQNVVNATLGKKTLYGSLTTEVVRPCTNYTVSVRCALDKSPWSEWSLKETVLSLLNVSAVQLNLWRKIEPPDISGTRRVVLMWKGISPSCKAIDGYRLEVFSGGNPKPISLYNTTRVKLSISMGEEAHIITLAAFRGHIIFPTEITYVPATKESVPEVGELQAVVHHGKLEVKWVPPVQPVRVYIVDWSTEGTTHNWIATRFTNISLTGLQSCKRYNVAVTPLFHDKTGLENRVQICSSEGAPGNVSIGVEPQDKSALVNWNVVPMTECSGMVINYTVFYWNNTGPVLNVTVESHKQEVLLEGLHPSMHFSVYVTASAVTGATSSIVTSFSTKKYSLTFITTLCVSGGLFAVLVLFTGLCCILQWKSFLGRVVPDPGLSSLALWTLQNSQEKHLLVTQQVCPSTDSNEQERIVPCEVGTMASDTSYSSLGVQDQQAEDKGLMGDQTEEELNSGPTSQALIEWEPRERRLDSNPTPASLHGSHRNDNVLITTSEETWHSFNRHALNPCLHLYCNQGPVERLGACGAEARSSKLEQKQHMASPLSPYLSLDMLEQGKRSKRIKTV